ncbi:MAG: TetR/AcrR family transcriptional regulator [Planctomycetes bacterium]|nr:TetR/AcrR family transcriptional regulator [Planctomycetota bacterium]
MPSRRLMIRQPKQARARESMARMLDAAETLFADGGEDALTVEAVTTRAATSVGSFYARFGDREGLLRAMHARYLENAAAAMRAAVDAAGRRTTLSSAVKAFVGVMCDAVHTHRDASRFFILHKAGDQQLRSMGIEANRALANAFEAVLARHASQVGASRRAVLVDTAVRLLFAMLIQHVMFAPEEVTGRAIGRKAAIAEISRVIVASLRAPPGSR